MEPNTIKTYIGIDVAKDNLDVCWHNQKKARFKNDATGVRVFFRQLAKEAAPGLTLVCEATGGYERLLVRYAHERKVPICLVNPARVRFFAKGKGILAKTDKIDSAVLQAFGVENRPRPMQMPTEAEQKIQALMVRRSQLSDELAKEKKRLANSSEITRQSLERMIEHLKKEIQEIEKELDKTVESDCELSAKAVELRKVCGVGPVTVWALLAFMPELGKLGRRRIASLAGLVPWPRDSGNKEGPRFTYGGRKRVRNILYMAATAARQHNPHLCKCYNRLISNGKHEKVALVAVMRKLLVHLNSLLQKNDFQVA